MFFLTIYLSVKYLSNIGCGKNFVHNVFLYTIFMEGELIISSVWLQGKGIKVANDYSTHDVKRVKKYLPTTVKVVDTEQNIHLITRDEVEVVGWEVAVVMQIPTRHQLEELVRGRMQVVKDGKPVTGMVQSKDLHASTLLLRSPALPHPQYPPTSLQTISTTIPIYALLPASLQISQLLGHVEA